MPLITIPFPKLTLAPRSGGIELSLETSVSLDRQETLQSLCTYSDLVTAVQDDQLWVARRGISLLVVDFTNDGSSISELERVMVTDWIERHEIWSRLGVRLVLSEYEPDIIRFSIQHPDISSMLAPPREALSAEFREVKFAIDVKTSIQEQQNAKGKKRPKSKKDGTASQVETLPELDDEGDGIVKENLYDALDPEAKRAVDDFLEGFVPVHRKRRRGAESRRLEPIENSRILVEGAIDIALFGGSKRVNGIKVFEGSAIQGLTQLFPGVFHMPHLKVISERASLLPILATSLARMTKAESPSLRRKTEDFKYGMPSIDMEVDDSEKVIRGLEKAAWCTLLKNVKTPALKPKGSTQPLLQQPTHHLATPVSSQSQHWSQESLTPNMNGSQASSASQRLATERWQSSSQTVTDVKRELGLSFETPMRTTGTPSQRRNTPLLRTSLGPTPSINATPRMDSRFPTPMRMDHVSSTYNSPFVSQRTSSPETWGLSPRMHSATPQLQQQQSFPAFVNATQYDRQTTQDAWGLPLQTNLNPSHAQQQEYSPGFMNSPQYFPASRDPTYYPQASQDQNHDEQLSQIQSAYHMGSRVPSVGFEAPESALDGDQMADPTDYGSFDEFLGSASMMDWDFGV